MMVRRSLPCLALSLMIWPTAARAANGLRPRTPAVFSDVSCVQTVTRGEPLVLDYSVPFDDTDLTPDELADSRTQQFFAFSRARFDFSFPVWVNQSDFDRADANGDITVAFDSDNILETSALWPSASWVRITPDDPRLPITMEQAAMGVAWDTTDTPPGTWLVAAYTWEPENNLWSPRFGAVRVEDPADPDATGPTVFLPREDGLLATRGEPLTLSGCVQAPEGSTITAAWATVGGGIEEPEWVPFLEDEVVENGALSLEFIAPAQASATVKVRVEITDPDGRTYIAYTPTTIAVVGEVMEGGDDDGGGGACTCSAERPRSDSTSIALFGLLLFGRRRRVR